MAGLVMIWRSRSEIRAMGDIVPIKFKQAEELIEESGIRRNVRVYRGKRFHSPVTSGLLAKDYASLGF